MLKNDLEKLIFEREKPLTCCLVLKDRGWILEKFALRLAENLPHWNVKAEIVTHPSSGVDLNHWMWYCDVDGEVYPHDTLFVTHVDRPTKYIVLKERLKKAALGLCMSRMTMQDLVKLGINHEKLCYVTPAHDGLMKPRRIVIGITSRLRTDKAKREDILLGAARMLRLDPFHFEIIGRGWEEVIIRLKEAGATVEYKPGTDNGIADYKINIERVPKFDYYLYLGFDEGSMGFLDALAAGVPTIVTPQGFHLDVKDGITYSFENEEQLCSIFRTIASDRQKRIDSVSKLTWDEYARKHSLIWHAIITGQQNSLNEESGFESISQKVEACGSRHPPNKMWYYFTNRKTFLNDFTILLELYTGFKFWGSGPILLLKKIKGIILTRTSASNRRKSVT